MKREETRKELRIVAAVAAAVLVPVVWRCVALHYFGFRPSFLDLRGFLLDVVLGSVAALGLLALGRTLKGWILLPLGVWCAVFHGAYQNVLALQAFPNIANLIYLRDATFIAGSVNDVKTMASGVAIGVVSLALGAWGFRVRVDRAQYLYLSAASVAGFLVLRLWVTSADGEEWRSTNPVVAMPEAAWKVLERRQSRAAHIDVEVGPLDEAGRALVRSEFRSDLSGRELLNPERERRPNVLLVVLEGFSGAYVPELRRFHGVVGKMTAPTLDRFHREHYSVPNFVVHQRQTNRGMYAILSGQLPNLVSASPKMSTVDQRTEQIYLPSVLRDAGYRTVFMQATEMGFMMMDNFMERAGFDEIRSDKDFSNASVRTGWGIDDMTLLSAVANRILQLEEEGRRWFVTALTCGSHHPYGSLIPDDFEPLPGEDEKARAFRFADHALGVLLDRLEKAGVLDNMLVLVTSDESAGTSIPDSALTRLVSSNWGLMAARLPDGKRHVADDTFGQSDIAVSVLDYLGIADPRFAGRSFFRDYDDPRSVFFANNSARTLGVFHESGELQILPEDRRGDGSFGVFDLERIFSVEQTEKVRDFSGPLVALGRRVEADGKGDEKEPEPITLAQGTSEFPHAKLKNFQWVLGGQYLQFTEDVVVTFEVEIAVHTSLDNEVRLMVEHHHHPPEGARRERVTSKFSGSASDGEVFRYQLVYRTGGDQGPMELNQYLESERNVPVDLEIRLARASPVPASEYPGDAPTMMAVYQVGK